MGLLFITLQRQKHGVVLWSEWEISHCLRLLTGLGSAPAITRITWALAISLSHPLLFLYCRRVDFTSVWRRKPEHGAREQAPKQGRKNPLWQSALAWHRSKQAYGKAKRMRNALSGRTGTWCRVLQDRLLDKSSRLFDMPGANLSAPTLLNFPLDSVYWEDTTGTTRFSHPSVHSLFLALCFIVSQAESAAVGKISCCFVLLPHFFPPPPLCLPLVCAQPVLVLCCGFALTDPQPPFMRILVWELPANPLLWVINIHDSIFGWHDWSMRWQSCAFVPWLDGWTFVNYFCQKWSLLCD